MVARIVLAGGSGYLGRHLSRWLVGRGDDVVVLTRARPHTREGVRFVQWDGQQLGPWVQALDGADAVVHLAGKRVDCRPTRANVDALISSRVQPVATVGQALAAVRRPPVVWVQMSTMAIYGDAGDTVIDDTVVPSGIGPRQMVGVATAWEVAFHQAAADVQRKVLLRAGIALGGEDDPATSRLTQLARLGLGGPVAGGDQWVSWIALTDLLRILVRAIDVPDMTGMYLATGPNPVTNARLMATYRRLVGRRVGLAAPAPIVKAGAWLMRSDPALAVTGRRGVPRRLLDEGFDFHICDLDDAVRVAVQAAAGHDRGVASPAHPGSHRSPW